MFKLLRAIVIGLAGLALLVGVLWWTTGRVRTPRISGPEAIASLETIELGGVEQWILIRGEDRRAPLLLFLHGGPGMPAMYLQHAFGRDLERDFVVVHWDQRGAGKSFSRELDPSALSVERVLADARELIDELQDRFGDDPILLVGHSWGSYLGMILAQRHPELFKAYVGVGQVTDPVLEAELADRFIRTTARERGLPEVVDEIDAKGAAVRETWLFEFGGELHGETNFLPLIFAGLRAPEYSWGDVLKVAQGSAWSSRNMRWDALEGPLSEEILAVETPVFFFLGRHDQVTPAELGFDYLERLDAPIKGAIWFESSAHFPFFEEPEAFAREIRGVATVRPHSPRPGAPRAPAPGS